MCFSSYSQLRSELIHGSSVEGSFSHRVWLVKRSGHQIFLSVSVPQGRAVFLNKTFLIWPETFDWSFLAVQYIGYLTTFWELSTKVSQDKGLYVSGSVDDNRWGEELLAGSLEIR